MFLRKITSLFSSRVPKSTRTRRPTRLQFEALEARINFSLVGFSTHDAVGPGVETRGFGERWLVINGTASADTATVDTTTDGKLAVTFNGKTTNFGGTIKGIEFWGGNGDDTLTVKVDTPVIAHGGAGNDKLYGGSGVDKLYGDLGNDALYGGGLSSADQLWGGGGRDRFLTQTGDVIRDGSGLQSFTGDDVEVRFADSGSATWSNREVREVDGAFQRLFDAKGNNRLLRDSTTVNPLTFTQADIKAPGENYDPYQRRTVTYTGPWWNQTEHIDLRTEPRKIVIDEWDESSTANNNFVRDVVIHEIGHNWENEHSKWNDWQKLSGWRTTAPAAADASKYQKSSDGQWWLLKSAAVVDSYCRTNPKEDFAQSWMAYFVQRFKSPNTYNVAALSTAKYNHLDNLIRGL